MFSIMATKTNRPIPAMKTSQKESSQDKFDLEFLLAQAIKVQTETDISLANEKIAAIKKSLIQLIEQDELSAFFTFGLLTIKTPSWFVQTLFEYYDNKTQENLNRAALAIDISQVREIIQYESFLINILNAPTLGIKYDKSLKTSLVCMVVETIYTLLENLTAIETEKTESARILLDFLIRTQIAASYSRKEFLNKKMQIEYKIVYHYLPSTLKLSWLDEIEIPPAYQELINNYKKDMYDLLGYSRVEKDIRQEILFTLNKEIKDLESVREGALKNAISKWEPTISIRDLIHASKLYSEENIKRTPPPPPPEDSYVPRSQEIIIHPRSRLHTSRRISNR